MSCTIEHCKRKRKRRQPPVLSEDPENKKEDAELQKLSAADRCIVSDINDTLKTWTATQLKSLLKDIKSLRSIDGKSIFEDISATGKKGDLLSEIKEIIVMVFEGEITLKNKLKRWENPHCIWRKHSTTYRDNVDFVSFKSRIQGSIRLVGSQSSKRSSRSNKNAIMSSSLLARLSACDKHQIIAALEALLKSQPDGRALATTLEQLLPKPNQVESFPRLQHQQHNRTLQKENTFKRHKALVAAIRKAQPRTRYGSSRDNYCYKRCRPAINAAKKAIVADGKALMNSKDWDSCLEYLVVEMERFDEFPEWDDAGNNTAVRDLKKMMKTWHGKVKKGLGAKVTPIQQKRLDKVAAYLAKE